MLVDPFQGSNLIMEASVEVSKGRIGLERWVSQEAEGVQTIVDGDNDNVGTLMHPGIKWPIRRIPVHVPYEQ